MKRSRRRETIFSSRKFKICWSGHCHDGTDEKTEVQEKRYLNSAIFMIQILQLIDLYELNEFQNPARSTRKTALHSASRDGWLLLDESIERPQWLLRDSYFIQLSWSSSLASFSCCFSLRFSFCRCKSKWTGRQWSESKPNTVWILHNRYLLSLSILHSSLSLSSTSSIGISNDLTSIFYRKVEESMWIPCSSPCPSAKKTALLPRRTSPGGSAEKRALSKVHFGKVPFFPIVGRKRGLFPKCTLEKSPLFSS